MLVSTQLAQVPTVNRLIKLWCDRYLPDLSALPFYHESSVVAELREAASATGRARTAAKLREHFVDENCKLAAIRTKELYTYLSGVINLEEARQLAQASTGIYLKLLDIYQASLPIAASSKEELWATFGDSALAAWGIPKIEKLAAALEPLLLQFQEKHLISKDWRTLGFLTTQVNFSNALLLKTLSPPEQVLISPYLNFLEEQLALPWQRVCAAAADHSLTSPAFVIVEKMLPIASEIAGVVYNRLLRSFPSHYSRRGRLDNPAIKHSCLRDLDMFQAYLWLCVLQGNLTVVEHELVALCIMVMESVGVKWEVTAQWNQLLMEEVLSRLDADQKTLVQPYTQGMIEAFDRHQDRLGGAANSGDRPTQPLTRLQKHCSEML